MSYLSENGLIAYNKKVNDKINKINEQLNKTIQDEKNTLVKNIGVNTNELTKAKEDYFHVVHEDLYKRLYEDFKKVWLEFQNASLLSYEGNYITANNSLKGNTDSLVLKGRTLQNLFKLSDKTPIWFDGAVPRLLVSDCCVNDNFCKSSTYTFYNFTNKNMKCDIYSKSAKTYKTVFNIPIGVSTQILGEDECFRNLSGRQSDGWAITADNISLMKQSVVLLQGNQSYIPNTYFEGIESVEGNVNVKSCGKNLFSTVWEIGDIESANGKLFPNGERVIRTVDYIRIFPNVKYMISRNLSQVYNAYRFYDINKNFLGHQGNIKIEGYRLENNIGSNFFKVLDNRVAYMKIVDFNVDLNIEYQIETNADTPTEFEPYVEDKITINQILRGSSTIQDTLDSDGILTRRWGSRPYQTGDELLNNVFTDKITTYYQLATPVTENINFRNLNSYKGTTSIITDGTSIQPLIITKIPSNVQAVVSSLSAENMSLNNQVSTLSEENTLLKSNVENLNDVTNTLLIDNLKNV